ncbi:MAG: LacI family DNA-binding transcriptional regulator [Propionibacteriaceae bacterium]
MPDRSPWVNLVRAPELRLTVDVNMSPPAGARPAVMADVARLAGVSNQTVSRVVNGAPSIAPSTRRRVERAIEQLGYRPNTAARALVRGRTGIVGVISAGSALFGPSSIQRTIEQAARDAGWFASTVSVSTLTRELLDDSVEHLLRQHVEGIIVVAGQDDALDVARGRTARVPIVLVEGDLTRAPWTVGVDQVAGARLATRHLLELGHREIVHVAGPQDWSEGRARREGWRTEMVAAGVRPPEPIAGDWGAEHGFAAGQRIAADQPRTTAVFAANDQIALGLLRALHEAGRRVPAEISVVGFDDLPETRYLIPPLTTVQQDFAAVGHRAIELLRQAIAGASPPRPELIQPRLVVRASTGART